MKISRNEYLRKCSQLNFEMGLCALKITKISIDMEKIYVDLNGRYYQPDRQHIEVSLLTISRSCSVEVSCGTEPTLEFVCKSSKDHGKQERKARAGDMVVMVVIQSWSWLALTTVPVDFGLFGYLNQAWLVDERKPYTIENFCSKHSQALNQPRYNFQFHPTTLYLLLVQELARVWISEFMQL